jgi:release factor glutamine methyltransferase
MTEEVWTPLKLINWTKDYFQRKGIEDARLEAELLLAHALGWKRIDLYSRFETPVPPEKLAAFREMVKRRASREPAQYIMGTVEFCGLAFRTDRRALIPRPETEIIIDLLAGLARPDEGPLIADIGTGSGCLAVTAAVRFPKAEVVACDVSEEALALAGENARLHGVFERVKFLRGDFAEALAQFAGRVDVAMANPPYVSEADLAGLAPELREHEPRVALISGPAGTELQARILDFAPALLKPLGHLVMEIGAGQAARVRKMAQQAGGLELLRFERDHAGIERTALLRKK